MPRRPRYSKKVEQPSAEEFALVRRWICGECDRDEEHGATGHSWFTHFAEAHVLWPELSATMMPRYLAEPRKYAGQIHRLWREAVLSPDEARQLIFVITASEWQTCAEFRQMDWGGAFIGYNGNKEVN